MKKLLGKKDYIIGGGRPEMSAQKGFTLVELSIVLVIIGLIIGGILKGQELIENARIKNVVSQTQAYQAAFVAFQDKYNGIAGDLLNAQLLIPNCTAAPCTPTPTGGNGNNIIGADAGPAYNGNLSANAENLAFWQQLASARFIGGIDLGTASTTIYGSRLPAVQTGGGFQIVYEATSGRHALRLAGAVGAPTAATGALRADQALQIDQVLDDGLPNTGSVITNGTISNATCFDVAANIYTAAQTTRSCNLVIIQ